MRRRSRGVSEIVANLFMATVVLSLGIAVYMYGSTHFQMVLGAMERLIQGHELALMDRFIVSRVFLNRGDDILMIIVYNYGFLDVEVVSVFVDGTLNRVYVRVPPGEWRGVVVPFHSWEGGSCTIVVASSAGNRYEVEVKL